MEDESEVPDQVPAQEEEEQEQQQQQQEEGEEQEETPPTDTNPPNEELDAAGQEERVPEEEEDAEEKIVEIGSILTAEAVGQHLSLLARTGNGLSHAYTRLEIHGKPIENIDVLETYLHLRYIDLSENGIVDISALASLEYLLSVDFHANKIKRIPASLDKRKYLQQANFAKNMIESIDIIDWPMLAWLNMNENKLSAVNLQEFEELLHLEARGNKITTTRGINSRKLEKLYLAGNQISTIELEEKANLQILHLRDNKITSLDGFHENLKSLTYLNLRNNLIEQFEEVWKLASLPHLKTLNLSDNPVTKLPNYRLETIFRLKSLEKLDKEPVTDDEREEAEQFRPKTSATTQGDVAAV
ncbi:hypothetical protein CcCBS67573_g03764 [Chytriomyces confervae]|uniref:U2A'/phosphoprotein 32 family A C-terminal domain-containing protein n=1 Tax=Chytriomyces confervae TaxID=246404 RepID=A0A507FF33_9FUNG|nr:hypothetical protein CcCBS67573_g03764 [Chytriomyces confervae]